MDPITDMPTEVTLGLRDYEMAMAEAYIGPARYNAVEAAKIVGRNHVGASNIIKRPRVQAYIAYLRKEWRVRAKSTAKTVMAELEYIAHSDITDIISISPGGGVVVADISNLNVATRKAIKRIKLTRRQDRGGVRGEYEDVLEIELHDKLPALRTLAKILGMGEEGPEGGDGTNKKVFGGLTIRGPKTQEEKKGPAFLELDVPSKSNSETNIPEEEPGVQVGIPRPLLLTQEVHLSSDEIWD